MTKLTDLHLTIQLPCASDFSEDVDASTCHTQQLWASGDWDSPLNLQIRAFLQANDRCHIFRLKYGTDCSSPSRLWNLCDHTFRNKLSLNSLHSKGDVELLLSARITTSPHPVYIVVEIALRALCTLREPSMSWDTSTAWSPALARGFHGVRNVHLSGQPDPSFQASQLSTAAVSSQCRPTIGP